MAPNENTELKLTLGALRLEYQGSEEFLKSELPRLVHAMDQLQTSKLLALFNSVQMAIQDSRMAEQPMPEFVV